MASCAGKPSEPEECEGAWGREIRDGDGASCFKVSITCAGIINVRVVELEVQDSVGSDGNWGDTEITEVDIAA